MSHKLHGWFSLILMAAILMISIASLITSSIIVIKSPCLSAGDAGMFIVLSGKKVAMTQHSCN